MITSNITSPEAGVVPASATSTAQEPSTLTKGASPVSTASTENGGKKIESNSAAASTTKEKAKKEERKLVDPSDFVIAQTQVNICRVDADWWQFEPDEKLWKKQPTKHVAMTFTRLWEKENEGYLSRHERDLVSFKVEKLLHDMESKAVKGAIASPTFPPGRMKLQGEPLLNTYCANHFVVPHSFHPTTLDTPKCGDTGAGLWEAFLMEMFGSALPRFHDLMSVFYRKLTDPAAEARSIPCLVLVGDPNSGKSLLLTKFIGALAGKLADGTTHFTGQDRYNAQLWSSPYVVLDDLKNLSEKHREEVFYRAHGRIAVQPSEIRGMYQLGFTAPWSGLLAIGLNWEQVEYLQFSKDTSTKFIVLEARSAYPKLRLKFEAEVAKAKKKGWDNWMQEEVLPAYAYAYANRTLAHPDGRFCVESYWDEKVKTLIPFPVKYRQIHDFIYEFLKELVHFERGARRPFDPKKLVKDRTPTSILAEAAALSLAPVARSVSAKELGAYLRLMAGKAPHMVQVRTSGNNSLFSLDPKEWDALELSSVPVDVEKTALAA